MDSTVYDRIMDTVMHAWSAADSKGQYLTAAKACQDLLYYAIMWATGLRPADTSNLKHQHLTFRSSGDWSLYVGVTKTRKKVRDPRILSLKVNSAPHGVAFAYALYERALQKINLSFLDHPGELFRTLKFVKRTELGSFGGKVAYCTMSLRFNRYLAIARLPEGLALHSFHGSRAARDRASGIPMETTCEEMDWTKAMYHYYLDGRDILSLLELEAARETRGAALALEEGVAW
jgi:integrase